MNEAERAVLVDILKTFYGEAKYTGTSIITEDAPHTRRAIAAIRDLLAAKSLDGMLAHLGRVKSLAMVYREYEQRYRTEVVVTTPEVDDETGNVVGRFNKTYEAFGGTRDESLRNVIAKAKGEKP